MAGFAKEVDEASFDAEVLKSEKPVLVDFWAPWCGPCKAIAPVIEALAEQYSATVKVCKMNVDDNKITPEKLGVRGIPTLMLFKGGKVVNSIVGNAPRNQIETLLKTA